MTKTIRSAPYDTMLVMGGEVSVDPLNLPALTKELQEAVEKKTRRIASVCTGAFILATAGLLDGRRATTHWKYSAQLQRHFQKSRLRVTGSIRRTEKSGRQQVLLPVLIWHWR